MRVSGDSDKENVPADLLIEEIETMYLAGASPQSMRKFLHKKYGVPKHRFAHLLRQVLSELAKDIADTPIDAIVARSESMLLQAFKIAKERKDPKAIGQIAERLVNIRTKTNDMTTSGGEDRDSDGNVKVIIRW